MSVDPVALRERYGARLISRIDALADGLRAAMDADTAMRAFHSIAGIAGTVGYPAATPIAREGEDACRVSFDRVSLAHLLDRLRDSVSSPLGPQEVESPHPGHGEKPCNQKPQTRE